MQGEASGAFRNLKDWHARHPQKDLFGELRKPFHRFSEGWGLEWVSGDWVVVILTLLYRSLCIQYMRYQSLRRIPWTDDNGAQSTRHVESRCFGALIIAYFIFIWTPQVALWTRIIECCCSMASTILYLTWSVLTISRQPFGPASVHMLEVCHSSRTKGCTLTRYFRNRSPGRRLPFFINSFTVFRE